MKRYKGHMKKQKAPLLRRKRDLNEFTPNELEFFRVTQPTENDVQEELDILTGYEHDTKQHDGDE